MIADNDARPDAVCTLCGVPADDRCDWSPEQVMGLPCERPLCWGCAVVTTDDAGGADVWCPEHALAATPTE
jgi:hypothetical protein